MPHRRLATTQLSQLALSTPTIAAVLVGPALTVLALGLTSWDPQMVAAARLVALLLWSPLPLGIPGLLLQDLRDQLAVQRMPMTRITAVTQYLFLAGPARVLAFSWLNLVGLVFALRLV